MLTGNFTSLRRLFAKTKVSERNGDVSPITARQLIQCRLDQPSIRVRRVNNSQLGGRNPLRLWNEACCTVIVVDNEGVCSQER
jgi:hypothetical protein